MTEKLSELLSNPWISLISLIITILSIILAIYFGVKSLPKKEIKVSLSSHKLISRSRYASRFLKLKILYGNEEVDSLTLTKVTFWNGSFPPINDTDIASAAPFCLTSYDGTILDAFVSEGKRTPNNINIKRVDEYKVEIFFDYLNRKEGGVLWIIHTGRKDSINVSNQLKGGRITTIHYRLIKIAPKNCKKRRRKVSLLTRIREFYLQHL